MKGVTLSIDRFRISGFTFSGSKACGIKVLGLGCRVRVQGFGCKAYRILRFDLLYMACKFAIRPLPRFCHIVPGVGKQVSRMKVYGSRRKGGIGKMF